MFIVTCDTRGRFGNNLIQYFSAKIFSKNFSDYHYNRHERSRRYLIIKEDELYNIIEKNIKVPKYDIYLMGFFQNISFLDNHRDFIKTLFNSNNTDIINHSNFKNTLVIKDLILNLDEVPGDNDVVIHIRLDDFIHEIHNSNILDFEFYTDTIVESNFKYNWNTIWIVVDKLNSDFDKKYISLLIKKLNENGITNIKFHQKTFLEDWNFCTKATNFISSNSTFALTAILVGNMKYLVMPRDRSWSNIVPLSSIENCKVVDVKRINQL